VCVCVVSLRKRPHQFVDDSCLHLNGRGGSFRIENCVGKSSGKASVM